MGSILTPRQQWAEPQFFLAAMVRVKDEGRFLPEWIAHHHSVGVEHFFVYDNGSTDATTERLEPFVRAGLVTHIPWPKTPISPSCYVDFLKRCGPSATWVCFFDADEFIWETRKGALLEALRNIGNAPALAVNWRYFGSSYHEVIPPGLVTDRFRLANSRLDPHIKVIAKPSCIFKYRNPHNFYYVGGRLAVTLGGRRVLGSFSEPEDHPGLVLHHFVYRSREDYLHKVLRRGFAEASGSSSSGRRLARVDAEFRRHNEVAVTPSERQLNDCRETLRHLGLPPELFQSF